MEETKLQAAIEAILFTMGDSVKLSQLADALQISKEQVRKLINEMSGRYDQEDRGIRLMTRRMRFSSAPKRNTMNI